MVALLKILSIVLGHLPRMLVLTLGPVLGSLVFRLDKKRRGVAIDNLRRAFGASLSNEDASRIVRKVFSNLAVMFFEFMRLPWLDEKRLDALVEFDGLIHFDEALKKGRGVIMCTAHYGNWELLALSLGLKGYPLDLVVREVDDPKFEEFVSWVRMRTGNRIIYKQKAMRKLLTRLKENAIITILLDQNVTHREGFFVDFFGTPACTNKGPALLALASGAPIVPIFIRRTARGHRVEAFKEIEYGQTGDRERDAEEVTRRCTKFIEEMIRRHPEEWFWVHRRWKTRPEPGKGLETAHG